MRKVVMAVLALVAAGGVQAQDGPYVGIQYSRIEYQEQGIQEINPTTLGVVLGQRLNAHFAAEVRFGTGMADDEVTVLGIPISLEVDNYFGVYMRGIAPVTEAFELYGLFGYTRGQLRANAMGMSFSETDSDISFGFGADLKAGDDVALNIEWARLLSEDSYDLNALSLGVRFAF